MLSSFRISRRLLTPGILLGSLLIILSPLFFYGRTLTPVYALGVLPTGAYGYSGPVQELYSSRDPVGAMGTDYAEWAYASRALSEGEIPFWNPHQGLGRPLVAEQAAGVFFPVSLLRHVLPVAYWDMVGVIYLLLAGVFLVMVARVVGLKGLFAAFVGIGAFASGYFQIYSSVITIIASSVWLPLLLFGIEWAHRRPDGRLRGLPVLVAAYALGTAGHATPAIFTVAFLAIYVVARSWQEPRVLLTFLRLLPYLLGGALLAAPQWLQFVHYIVASNTGLLTLQDSAPFGFYRFWHLPAIVFPYLYGPLNELHPLGIGSIDFRDYWGLGWLPAAVMFPAFAGILWGWRSGNPALRAMLVTAGVMTLWAIHVPPFTILAKVPILWRLNFNYFWVPLQVVLLVHAGFGLRYLCRSDHRAWKRAILGWFAFCLVMLLVAFGYLAYEILVAGKSAAGFQRRHLIPGLGAGLAWAVAVPLCLWAVRAAASGPKAAFHLIALAGLILSAISYFPYATSASVGIARWGAITAYLLITAVTIIVARQGWSRCQRWAWTFVPAAGLVLTYGAAVMRPGLLHRMDPTRPAPYVAVLQERAGSERVYGMDGYLTLNYAGAFGVSAVNNLTALMPPQPLRFFESYLDHHQFAAQFYGIPHWARVSPADPLGQFQFNRRFWDYVGVRYLVLGANHPNERVVATAQDQVLMQHGDTSAASPRPLRPSSTSDPFSVDAVVDCKTGAFSSVDVMLSTYGRRNPGKVVLQVLTSQGAVFTAAEVEASKLVDNKFQTFTLGRTACTDWAESMRLRLQYRGSDPNFMLAYWAPAHADGFVYRRLGTGTPQPSVPVLHGDPSAATPLPLRTSLPGTPAWVEATADCRHGPFRSVDVMLSTYARTNTGRVELQVWSQGALFTRAEVDASKVANDAYQTFELPRTVCLDRSESVQLRLQYHRGDPDSLLAYWSARTAAGFVYRRMGEGPDTHGNSRPELPTDLHPVPLSGAAHIRTRCVGTPMSALEIRLSTYGRANPGRLVLTLRATDDASVLGRSTIDSATVVDNARARFAFDPPACGTSEREVIAELTHEGGTPGQGLAYWRSQGTGLIDYAVKASKDGGVTEIFADDKTGARVWENRRAQPRVYVAPEFEQRATWGEAMQAFGELADLRRTAVGEHGGPVCRSNAAHPAGEPAAKVHRISVGPNTVEADLDAHTAGTLVVTDNYEPGWEATVNGKGEPAQRVNGTFRGVCIPAPGRYNVSWRYRPPLWNLSLWMAAAGALLALGAFTFAFSRRG